MSRSELKTLLITIFLSFFPAAAYVSAKLAYTFDESGMLLHILFKNLDCVVRFVLPILFGRPMVSTSDLLPSTT